MAPFAKWISAAIGCVSLMAGPCVAAQASAAQPQSAVSAATAQAAPPIADNNYILGPQDTIAISVLGQPDFNGGASRIDADGKIQLRYLGTVKVSEQTAAQIADQVTQLLQKADIYTHPVVKVEIINYSSRYVTVLGAFRSPGLVPVDHAYRVSEILAKVGGVSDNAADYLLLTPENGPQKRLVLKDLATGDSTQDPYVQPGDKLYSPMGDFFYISGEVKTPSTFGITPGLTVGQAIARAGGLTDLGSDKHIKVTRKGQSVEVKLEDKVQPNDVIFIKQRLF
jgi:polysaccharide export outer membrane protein